MTFINKARRRVPLALATLVASGALAACGSSSGSGSSSTSTSPSSSSANRSAFVTCLQQHGVAPPPGGGNGGKPPAGAKGGGVPASGSGNTARQAAFTACGANGQHSKGSAYTSSEK